ncbi:hypothetical protein PR001_g7292 [Phytophthora rubi]|uniref:Uncharacterized protein n=1 Tax=Phytophthora rubi TaxID=129364 RepID=A0A6A3N965_9STRA|nr:hypothetical protein PR001_g7292 [Phytophthora rubi]KAE9048596.1 hypothetical protein PR002_g359 [Phytophthora rubi]
MFQGLLYLTPLLARLDVALHNFVESAENKLYGQIPHYGESGSHLARPSLAAQPMAKSDAPHTTVKGRSSSGRARFRNLPATPQVDQDEPKFAFPLPKYACKFKPQASSLTDKFD